MKMNYEPGEVADIPESLFREAKNLGFQVLRIICERDDSEHGDFWTMTSFLPNIGDEISMEDGGIGKVEKTIFAVSRIGENISLVPNVIVKFVDEHSTP